MAFKTISVLLTADSTSLRAQLLGAARDIDKFGRSATAAGNTGRTAGELLKVGLGAGALVAAAGLGAAALAATGFEGRMRNVNSISKLSEAELGAVSDRVLDLSRELPQSANTLAEGLYEIASSGFQGAEGLQVLEQSAKAASAGLTTTANSAKAITAVLNAYGLQASDAADVSDTLFQTVNLGVVNFEELTGVIGDTVGTAAAAKVDIAQVGAAIATMTLSGISASEAGTSLNRVLQSIIKPSESLALVLQTLGYESGAQALETDGLRGVMEKLRVATGGNVDAFLDLFPEIRAARGAFALAADEGRTYAEVSGQIADQNQRAGATSNALAEQMKGLGLQVRVFLNGIGAGAIKGATPLLGFLKDTFEAANTLGRASFPGLQSAAQALQPFLRNLAQTGADVADVARDLVSTLDPAGKALAGLLAGSVIASLTAVSVALSTVSGFLADNEELVTALAIAYGVKLGAALASQAVTLAASGMETLALKLLYAKDSATAATSSFLTLRGAATALSTVGLVLTLTAAVTAFQNARRHADEFYDELVRDIDLDSVAGIEEAFRRIGAAQDEVSEKAHGGLLNSLKGTLEVFTPLKNTVIDAQAAYKKLGDESGELARKQVSLDENLSEVSHATGISTASVELLARALKVDLTQGYGASGEERDQLVQHFKDLAAGALGGGQALEGAATISIEALTEMRDAVDKTVEKVSSAFASATDVVSGFASAAEGTGLEEYYRKSIEAAESFSDGITTAARKGLDPAVIKRLLEAGPEQAAPLLQAIAADHSGKLVALVNESERQLAEINTKVVAFARLTQQAVNSVDDQKVKDLGLAMAITAAEIESGGKRTAEAVAKDINQPLSEVIRVAKDFGITVAGLPGTLSLDSSEARAAIQGLMDDLRVTRGLAEISVKLFGVEGARAALNGLRRDTGNILADVGRLTPIKEADGGVVRYYAAGGLEQHVAQVAPAGVTRIWAEPETGGEAYIPMGRSKRGRSTRILASVASEFGYALVPHSAEVRRYAAGSPGGSPGALVIDYDRLARALAATARVEVPLYLNGREIARAATPEISREMASIRRARS